MRRKTPFTWDIFISRMVHPRGLPLPHAAKASTWNVLASPVFLSDAQIAEFIYDGNARPVQQINQRQLLIDNG